LKSGAFELTSAGFFPRAKNARVFWMGIEDSGLLLNWTESVYQMTKNLGLVLDEKKFHPHITLARLKNPRAGIKLEELAMRAKSPPLYQKLNSLCLFESLLEPNASRYNIVEEFGVSL
jgi:2'-5' RNA ligase